MDCGECTACCTLLPINAIGKPINTQCKHCENGIGCSVYDNKPQTCTEFECAYHQVDNIPDGLRPDKCGIIFIKRDGGFMGVVNPAMEVSDMAKAQISDFERQGYEVINGYL